MTRILFISNGHGEDRITRNLIRELLKSAPSGTEVSAWPMVGEGRSYTKTGVSIVGAKNLLPSEGLAGIQGVRSVLKDIEHGALLVVLRQIRSALNFRGCFDLVIAVGDIVVILTALLTGTPFLFVGCAKSSRFMPAYRYNFLEKRLLAQYCAMTFPRDAETSEELTRTGVVNKYVGNPMMDGLEGTGERFGTSPESPVAALLAGSREDAEDNALVLLDIVSRVYARGGMKPPPEFLFAAHDGLNVLKIRRQLMTGPLANEYSVDESPSLSRENGLVLSLRHACGGSVRFVKGHFADVLRSSILAVGMAGTANQQAMGLGLPVVVTPPRDAKTRNYLDREAQACRKGLITCSYDPESAASSVIRLLENPLLRNRMSPAGPQCMGPPGASRAIAEEILKTIAVPDSASPSKGPVAPR